MTDRERRRIRVLSLVTRLNVGGPARLLRTLHRHIDESRFDWRLGCGVIEEDEIEAPWAAEVVDFTVPDLVRAVSPLRDARAYSAVSALIRDFRPDVVHTHLAKAGWIGRLAASRAGIGAILHTYHGNTFQGYWGPLRGRIFLGLERHAARRSHRVIVQSEGERAQLLGSLGPWIEPKLVTIAPGLDFDEFRTGAPSSLRSELGLTDERVVAFVGRLTAVKNCVGFLRVLRRLRERGLRVVGVIAGSGDADHERRLHDLVDELELRESVRWLGTRQDVRNIYALADVLALTSKNEGTPLVLAEALAAGTSVAAYDVGGVRDVVADCRRARLVDRNDEEAMAREIIELLETDSSEERERDAALVVERFAPARWARRVEGLYGEVVGSLASTGG